MATPRTAHGAVNVGVTPKRYMNANYVWTMSEEPDLSGKLTMNICSSCRVGFENVGTCNSGSTCSNHSHPGALAPSKDAIPSVPFSAAAARAPHADTRRTVATNCSSSMFSRSCFSNNGRWSSGLKKLIFAKKRSMKRASWSGGGRDGVIERRSWACRRISY